MAEIRKRVEARGYRRRVAETMRECVYGHRSQTETTVGSERAAASQTRQLQINGWDKGHDCKANKHKEKRRSSPTSRLRNCCDAEGGGGSEVVDEEV